MKRRRRRHQAGDELRAETGLVHIVVEATELVFGRRELSERSDHGETAVGLFDVGVEPAGVGPLGDEQSL